MKKILALFVLISLAGAAFGSPIGEWNSDHSTTQMEIYVEFKADKSLSMALRLAGSQAQWFKGTYTATNFTVWFPEKIASFPFEIHEDVLFLSFIATTPTRLLRVENAYPEAKIYTAQKLYEENQISPLKMVPGPVELPNQFPRLDAITRVDLYQVSWVAGPPRKIDQQLVPNLIPKKVDLFSITNLTDISDLYRCLQTNLTTPCTLSLAGYASYQAWYSGTNEALNTSLLNLHSSVVVECRGSPSAHAIFGKSLSFARKVFELHAKHLPGFAQRYAEHFSSDESLAGDKHSFWEPSKQWKVQQDKSSVPSKAAPSASSDVR